MSSLGAPPPYRAIQHASSRGMKCGVSTSPDVAPGLYNMAHRTVGERRGGNDTHTCTQVNADRPGIEEAGHPVAIVCVFLCMQPLTMQAQGCSTAHAEQPTTGVPQQRVLPTGSSTNDTRLTRPRGDCQQERTTWAGQGTGERRTHNHHLQRRSVRQPPNTAYTTTGRCAKES